MNIGKLVFAQIMAHLPLTTFRRCVARYHDEYKVKTFSCLDQYLCMTFAQLTNNTLAAEARLIGPDASGIFLFLKSDTRATRVIARRFAYWILSQQKNVISFQEIHTASGQKFSQLTDKLCRFYKKTVPGMDPLRMPVIGSFENNLKMMASRPDDESTEGTQRSEKRREKSFVGTFNEFKVATR